MKKFQIIFMVTQAACVCVILVLTLHVGKWLYYTETEVKVSEETVDTTEAVEQTEFLERAELAPEERELVGKEEQPDDTETESPEAVEREAAKTPNMKPEKTPDSNKYGNIPQYARSCEIGEIAIPIKRGTNAILAKLAELGKTDTRIAEICGQAPLYPENILEGLANNPEMADFVSGYLEAERLKEETPTESSKENVGLTEEEKQMEYPLFLQWDKRWGYADYGDDSNIGLAGCGPTSLAMALYYLTGNELLTPGKIAEYAMKNGYYMRGTGTLWALMDDVPVHYGVTSENLPIEEQAMKDALDAGHILISAMRKGDFTAAGHFIVIYGYEEDGFLVNDPNCVARSRMTWEFDRIRGQMKQLWALGK